MTLRKKKELSLASSQECIKYEILRLCLVFEDRYVGLQLIHMHFGSDWFELDNKKIFEITSRNEGKKELPTLSFRY